MLIADLIRLKRRRMNIYVPAHPLEQINCEYMANVRISGGLRNRRMAQVWLLYNHALCSNICTVAVTGFPAFAFPIEGE